MAGWLEQLEGVGGSLLDAASEGLASRIKSELNPEAPTDPVNRPETQYDTQIEEPIDGPEAYRAQGGVQDVWGQYKWWIVGGLSLTAYLALKR